MRHAHKGAVLIYGLFTLMIGAVALIYLFNTGQLVREKTQLVNAADAVAYSAGVTQARALNYLAYTNRAYIANEVLVAQALSLSAWSDYLSSWNQQLAGIHPECFSSDPGLMSAGISFKYNLNYALACWTLAHSYGLTEWQASATHLQTDLSLRAIQVSQLALQHSQRMVVSGLTMGNQMPGSIGASLNDIARQNFPEDPDGIRVVAGFEAMLPDDWASFSSDYAGNRRQRLKDLVVQAADDGHLRDRNWTSRALLPVLCGWGFRHQEVRRRGGTELLGFEEWHAADTQSFQRYWTRWRWSGPSCRTAEVPTGYASIEAHAKDMEDHLGGYGSARSDTPHALQIAQGVAKTTSNNYSGLPNIRDLSASQLSRSNPVLRLGVRLERDRARLRVSDGKSSVQQGTGHLSPFVSDAPSSGRGSAMHAVAISEVFYQNPDPSYRTELGSLFQPYWQVRLVPAEVTQAWLGLGMTPPR